ncbi:hypothetical protein LLEC1_01828 [Akanthomyces lecanii]|uniref:Uncharacterized protein n=1 Tax=Cordyceps confragosa TaxID=2714763 RepID=A0A179IJ19_CORDF|nr:hypothetical protein LLEC1_01828 [Akanthomyces lecanii]
MPAPRSLAGAHGQALDQPDGNLLANAMRESGITENRSRLVVVEEKVRRFFWGLAHEPNWSDALPLVVGNLNGLGVATVWSDWREVEKTCGCTSFLQIRHINEMSVWGRSYNAHFHRKSAS